MEVFPTESFCKIWKRNPIYVAKPYIWSPLGVIATRLTKHMTQNHLKFWEWQGKNKNSIKNRQWSSLTFCTKLLLDPFIPASMETINYKISISICFFKFFTWITKFIKWPISKEANIFLQLQLSLNLVVKNY